jgi:hypothetical protein
MAMLLSQGSKEVLLKVALVAWGKVMGLGYFCFGQGLRLYLDGPGALLDSGDGLVVGAFPLPLGSWGKSTALSLFVLSFLMCSSVLGVHMIVTFGGGVPAEGLDGMELDITSGVGDDVPGFPV